MIWRSNITFVFRFIKDANDSITVVNGK